MVCPPDWKRLALRRRIAIVGGGLAGIAAALKLAEADCQPIIIESRKILGGRATSFVDPRSGEVIDNCQHVLMGCCTNLIDLYDRLGVLDKIDWHRKLYWTHTHGEIDCVKASWLPAPFHLAPSFARMGLLQKNERKQIQRAMWRMIRLGAKGRLSWAGQTFSEFLADTNQAQTTIRTFWNTVITSACNLGVDRVDAAHAIQVFQDGFLGNRWSYTMGLASVPLVELYQSVQAALKEAGGEIHLSRPARAIAYDGRRVTGVVTGDGVIEAAAVISAVPFDRLDKLISDTMRAADARLATLNRFEFSPILGVHLWFDQPIMEPPHLILPGGGVQWLFNKGIDERGRQYIHAVISAADEWMKLDEDQIIDRVVRDIHDAAPKSIGLKPIQARSIKEKRATFAATPQAEQFRPGASAGYVGVGGGGIENLFLAGDWCDTGWPATMEGAVRSGFAAAAAITGGGGLVEDVPPGLFARWLGLR